MDGISSVRNLLLVGSGGAPQASPAAWARAGAPGTGRFGQARFTIRGDFVLPRADTATLLPLGVTTMQDGGDVTLQRHGRVLVNTSGRYRVTLGVGWRAHNDIDAAHRMAGIRRWPGSLPDRDDCLARSGAPETVGEPDGSWQLLRAATEDLMVGQLIYAVVRSRKTGDCVQATRTTFLQIERFA